MFIELHGWCGMELRWNVMIVACILVTIHGLFFAFICSGTQTDSYYLLVIDSFLGFLTSLSLLLGAIFNYPWLVAIWLIAAILQFCIHFFIFVIEFMTPNEYYGIVIRFICLVAPLIYMAVSISFTKLAFSYFYIILAKRLLRKDRRLSIPIPQSELSLESDEE